MKLVSSDLLVLFLYLMVVVGAGLVLRDRARTGEELLRAGRKQSTWLGVLAMLGVSLGAPELIGIGAAGARYGFAAAQFLGIGSIPAMLFAALCLVPIYYGSKARTIPEFVGRRFDGKTRVLHAGLFAAMMVFSSGVSLAVIAQVMRALHVFDGLLRAYGWEPGSVVPFMIVLASVVVLLYVVFGGLLAALANQAVQFLIVLVGLLPVVLAGLGNVGGWAGLKAALPAGFAHEWAGGSTGVELALLAFLLGSAYWCSEFRVLQIAMAAKDVESARRMPLFAAAPRIFFPLVLVIPGMLAVGLPTPQTHTAERIENGAIIHETTVVRPEVEAGRGLVPARLEAPSGKPMLSRNGEPVLDYEMATPNALVRFIPNGLLGLGLAALLASLMSGLAANLTAFSAVFTFDLYRPIVRKELTDRGLLIGGRLAALGATMLAAGAAFALAHFDGSLQLLLGVFASIALPIFAVLLMGIFWKRTTGHGAFAGLITGPVAGLLFFGLTMQDRGDGLASALWTAVAALGAALCVGVAVSLFTTPRPEQERAGLVYSLRPCVSASKPEQRRRLQAIAAVILALAIVLNLALL